MIDDWNFRRIAVLLAGIGLLADAGMLCDAATLRFKQTVVVGAGFVRVSDVADVLDADADLSARLSSITLAPAPGPGRAIKLGHEAIRSRLAAQGVDVSQVEFSGRSVVTVKAEASPVQKTVEAPTNNWLRRQQERNLIEKIAAYISSQKPDLGPIDVSVTLTAEQSAFLAAEKTPKISGGQPPWTGMQAIDVVLGDGSKKPRLIEVDCKVTLRPSVVQIVRSVRHGQIIGEADVDLRPAASESAGRSPASTKTSDQVVTQLTQVVGSEALRNLSPNETVSVGDFKKVTLVQRNSIVSVVSRVGSIQVSTDAKARSEGGLGDTVDLVSLDGKHRYSGTVVGYHEVRTGPAKQAVTQLRVVPEILGVRE